jgi:hypothetical protein
MYEKRVRHPIAGIPLSINRLNSAKQATIPHSQPESITLYNTVTLTAVIEGVLN